MSPRLQRLLHSLASVQLTLFCLGMMMILVVFGTLAQVELGTFTAQKEFFDRWFVYGTLGDWHIPAFPGGLLIGSLWLVNLFAAFIVRFRFRRRDTGVLISHFGVILLLAGQGATQTFAREAQMPIEVGQTRQYSEDPRDTELVLIDSSNPSYDEVTSIPWSIFSRRRFISLPGMGVTLHFPQVFLNAELARGSEPSLATQGVGTGVSVREQPPVSADDEVNNVTAFVEVRAEKGSLGTWLVSSALGAPQSFTVNDRQYRFALRPRRTYYPFRLTLKEFHHDRYPGTDIPRNFSSLVRLENPATGENRDALIYMNHPLRYEGHTFYQASFGKGDTLSVFQVVKNPAWITPYLSCTLVVLGLAIQFLMHLSGFVKRQ